jgi:glycosyltransferase involved in cell wall biosynthesis
MNQENKNRPAPFAQDAAVNVLRACISGASFWTPEYISKETSAWLEHAPFAFWLTEMLRPRVFVELGTHRGFSYFVFCEAVQRLRLPTQCYAVDTWTGDEHSGFYGEEVFQTMSAAHDQRYSAFSTLIRSTFEVASHSFSNGYIDLLHIDGRHYYDDVKSDYEAWRPKLSDRSVVLFHDINVREREFGVYRLWEELRCDHPHFEFLHGHGLGALGVGRKIPRGVVRLFAAARAQEATAFVRTAYARLGWTLRLQLTAECQAAELCLREAELGTAISQLRAEKEHSEIFASELFAQRRRTAQLESHTASVSHRLMVLESAVHARGAELTTIRESTSWRVTSPLRWFATKLRWLATKSRQVPLYRHLRVPARSTGEIRLEVFERNPDESSPATRLGTSDGWFDLFSDSARYPQNERIREARSVADISPIRLLAVTHNLNHEGAPNSQFEVVTGLHRLGVIEPVVLSPDEGPLASAYREAGVQVRTIATPTVETSRAFEESARAIARSFQESNAEIVYANTLQTFWAIAIAERAQVPAVWNVHESEPPESYFDFLGPQMRSLAYRCLQYPHSVVFVADATRRMWEPLKSRNNFITIKGTLDLDRLRERSAGWDRAAARAALGVSDGEVILLLTGTVCERKGQLDLLRSLPLLPAELMSRLRIFFVGDRNGPYSSELHSEANALPANMSSRIAIVAETHEPYLYFRASDIAVCCSRIESYPRVILEAMAFDLPLVTTPVFGIVEQVQENVNALFYPPGDIAQLASHLARLISDDILRAEMASASSRILASLHNHNATLNRYACLFREARLDWAGPRNS